MATWPGRRHAEPVTDPTTRVDFSNTSYSGTHRVPDILVETHYLINVPIVKRHGGAGITLALKNHLGSIEGFYSGGHTMHQYFYLGGSEYQSNRKHQQQPSHQRQNGSDRRRRPLRLRWRSNNTPPERWSSFFGDSPNMLFFAADPVAIDSIEIDGAGNDISDPDPPQDPPPDPAEDLPPHPAQDPPADPDPNEDNPTDSSYYSRMSDGCFISCLR